jgi:hypothetical protein
MDPTILGYESMNRIAFQCVQNFVVTCVVRRSFGSIPRTGSGVVKHRVLRQSFQISVLPCSIRVALKICNRRGVIKQLVAA